MTAETASFVPSSTDAAHPPSIGGWVFGITMTLALGFGFLGTVWPDSYVSFERLHVFFFNLCAGGTLVLHYAEGPGRLSTRGRLFYLLAMAYALCAACAWYIPALIISLPMLAVVESVRNSRFSFFPIDFFRWDAKVSDKFCQASLLCLSCGIVIASLVIINQEYYHVVELEKLTLDVFFLGYSFPISLITMSVMLSFMEEHAFRKVRTLSEVVFWTVNLGVIIFFLFIIFEIFIAEVIIATTLFIAVSILYVVFLRATPRMQQRVFLASGMAFLMGTALTGIALTAGYFLPSIQDHHQGLLNLHRIISLYGWNLSGLFIILRWSDFPIRMNSGLMVAAHWVTVFLLVPLGYYSTSAAGLAMLLYVWLLGSVLLGQGTRKVRTG